MRFSGLVCGAVIAGVACLCTAQTAQARPDYNKAFWAMYEKEIGKEAETTKCNACHFGQEKKNRNDYGKAVGEAIGEKNSKDGDKIKKGLEKAAKGKSSVEGKTFGDLIKDGKLPGKAP
jgi:hypothetical protein